ncbi:putative transcriptional regulator [Gottschalkia purinilytica]|uniref:Putative transcriptional regulator n=1 Tax=Gottschalkia purinilytica TaxID=1503 RepID=A0A0L0WD28_GOTPU|nr:helix-turn-helix domain-containing protein [Gottschalkia purinilytica]KNF09325.1 putative transcriptional regulator [Gottschalkia purinilytica]
MIGDNIKLIRQSKGLGLNETARLANISGSYLSNIEKGIKENPSMDTLQKIANALNVSVNDLFGTKAIHEILYDLRKEKNISKEHIANFLNIPCQEYEKYESGKLHPSYETLKLLAEFFNVSLDYLLGKANTRNLYDNINEHDLTQEELQLLEKIKSDPEISILFHDLKNAPKKKIKQLLSIWDVISQKFDEMDEEDE